MNDMFSKTLLLSLIIFSMGLFSCTSTQVLSGDFTANKKVAISNEDFTLNHFGEKPEKKKGRRSVASAKPRVNKKAPIPSKKVSKPKATVAKLSKRQAIIQYAQTLEGIPYIYGGKSELGFDCSGFTSYVFTQKGEALHGNSSMQTTQGNMIPLSEAQKGDLVFFGTAEKVTHVGIIAEISYGKLVVVHASSSNGVITQDISNSKYWQAQILYAVDVLSDKKNVAHNPARA